MRIVASSRVRCAIVIESEFAITKLPTKSAIPPNASRKPRRNVMNELVSCGVLRRLGGAESRLRGARQDRLARVAGSPRPATLGFAGDRDLVELALLVEEPLGGRQVEAGERRAAE